MGGCVGGWVGGWADGRVGRLAGGQAGSRHTTLVEKGKSLQVFYILSPRQVSFDSLLTPGNGRICHPEAIGCPQLVNFVDQKQEVCG